MLPKGHLPPDHAAMHCMADHQTGLMLGGAATSCCLCRPTRRRYATQSGCNDSPPVIGPS
jgi:hypothetical protein